MKDHSKVLEAFCDALEKRMKNLSEQLDALSKHNAKLMIEFNDRLQTLESLLPSIPSVDEISTLKNELRRYREAGEILVLHLNKLLRNLPSK